jgi:hypothetical protein
MTFLTTGLDHPVNQPTGSIFITATAESGILDSNLVQSIKQIVRYYKNSNLTRMVEKMVGYGKSKWLCWKNAKHTHRHTHTNRHTF